MSRTASNCSSRPEPTRGGVIGALNTGDLYVGQDNKIYIHTDGGYLDARTGQPAADITDDAVNNVHTNNAVRRAADCRDGHAYPVLARCRRPRSGRRSRVQVA